MFRVQAFLLFLLATQVGAAYHSQYVIPHDDGTLVYAPYNDYGDTFIDFSRVGYRHGDFPIPTVPVVTTLKPIGNGASDVANIQKAIYDMASRPVDSDGFRGAILLEKGEFNIDSAIYLNVSGVVIRGSGRDATVLYGSGKFPYDLIQAGNFNVTSNYYGKGIDLREYVRVGTRKFEIASARSNFKIGDLVFVHARKNDKWIEAAGMNMLKYYAPDDRKDQTVDWKPFESRQARVVTAVSDNSIEIDVPLVEAVDPQWGGGYIKKYTLDLPVDHVGIEDLSAYSYFDPKIVLTISGKNKTQYYADEKHAERLITFYGVQDGFARRISGKYFNHFVSVQKFSKRVTVSDAQNSDPVSILDGGRRYTFHIHKSSEVLFENCHSSGARHAFIFNYRSTGPNVFYNCTSVKDYATSEPHDGYSVGALYDNCNAQLAIQNRLFYGTGHGWGGANFVAWNTEGTLQLQSPVPQWNFAIGHVGVKKPPTFEYAVGGVNRTWEHYGVHVEPKSLFLAQRVNRQISGN